MPAATAVTVQSVPLPVPVLSDYTHPETGHTLNPLGERVRRRYGALRRSG